MKEFKYFYPKKLFLYKYDPDVHPGIVDPVLDFLPIPDPGVKTEPDLGSGSAILFKRKALSQAAFWPVLKCIPLPFF
jgi:hypothetical protein